MRWFVPNGKGEECAVFQEQEAGYGGGADTEERIVFARRRLVCQERKS